MRKSVVRANKAGKENTGSLTKRRLILRKLTAFILSVGLILTAGAGYAFAFEDALLEELLGGYDDLYGESSDSDWYDGDNDSWSDAYGSLFSGGTSEDESGRDIYEGLFGTYSTLGDASAVTSEMSPQVTITQMEGKPEPGHSTHKGFVHTRINLLTEKDASQKDYYLPVVVTPDKDVYVPLEAAASALGLKTHEITDQKIAVTVDSSDLVFTHLSSKIDYVPEYIDLENSTVLEGRLPMEWFDERWCVGLDDFLNATGCTAEFQEEDEDGYRILDISFCNIPSQLAAFRRFISQADDKYRFYMSDIGYTGSEKDLAWLKSAIVSYLGHFTEADLVVFNLTGAVPLPSFQTASDHYYDKKYLDMYMAHQAVWNEEIGNALMEKITTNADLVAKFLDIVGKESLTSPKNVICLLDRLNIQSDDVRRVTTALGDNALEIFRSKGFSVGSTVLGNLLNYACISEQYKSGDEYSGMAVQTFINNWSVLKSYLSYDMINTLEKEAKRYQSEGKDQAVGSVGRFLEKHAGVTATEVLVDLLAAEFATPFVVVDLAWSALTGVFAAGKIRKADSFMSCYYGIKYQMDAIEAAEFRYKSFLVNSAHTNDEWKELEQLMYNAAKACYCCRYLGLDGNGGVSKDMENADAVAKEQQVINDELAKLCAEMRTGIAYRGFLPRALVNHMTDARDLYPEVILNIAELFGQVTDANTKEGVKGVAVEIFSDAGNYLDMDSTDEDGMFHVSFDLDDGDIYSGTSNVRTLTLKLLTEEYAAQLVPVTVHSGKRYQVDGLQVGELDSETFFFLEKASEQDGHIVLDVHLVQLQGDAVKLEPRAGLGTGDPIYMAVGGQISIREELTQLMLPIDFTLETVYGHMFEQLGGLGQLLAEYTREADMDMDTLMKDELATAEEINTYLELYGQYGGGLPAYKMKASNSKVKTLEPVFIVYE